LAVGHAAPNLRKFSLSTCAPAKLTLSRL
jgi:hypothetical protein